MVILPCLRGEQNAALSLAWSPRRGEGDTPGTYNTYNRIVHGSRGPATSPRSRISTKAERRDCEVVIRHRSFVVKRLPTITTPATATATTMTTRYQKRTCGDTIAYIRTLLSLTLWRTIYHHTTHQAGRYYFRRRRRNRIPVDDAYGRALLCYGCAVTALPLTYRVGELLRVAAIEAETYPGDKGRGTQAGCLINTQPVVSNSTVPLGYLN